MENTSCHSVTVDKEGQCILWFSGKNFPYDLNQTQTELLGLVPLTKSITMQDELIATAHACDRTAARLSLCHCQHHKIRVAEAKREVADERHYIELFRC
jgi:hypothetical protein